MYTYLILQALAVVIAIVAAVLVLKVLLRVRKRVGRQTRVTIDVGVAAFALASALFVFSSYSAYPFHFALPPMMQAMTHDKKPASVPLPAIFDFLINRSDFEAVDDIGRDPNDVPAPIGDRGPEEVEIHVHAKEVVAEIAPGIVNNYWTYDGTVPGPMMRVREGDTVTLTLSNDETSLHPHNIDLHAVTGPGGGGAVTLVQPGETKSFKWKALHPGLYVYHCATPNISTHNAHGQYGMILVEPKGGMDPVDKEFYVMQGELYTVGGIGKKGLVAFDSKGLVKGDATYVTFNGRIEGAPRMKAQVGDKIRMYVGNGGVNLISSFHVIGEIFDRVYPEAAMGKNSAVFENVQTTAVLPGGAAIVEFTVDVPGNYILVDHALARMNKGAWAILEVEGEPSYEVFEALGEGSAHSH